MRKLACRSNKYIWQRNKCPLPPVLAGGRRGGRGFSRCCPRVPVKTSRGGEADGRGKPGGTTIIITIIIITSSSPARSLLEHKGKRILGRGAGSDGAWNTPPTSSTPLQHPLTQFCLQKAPWVPARPQLPPPPPPDSERAAVLGTWQQAPRVCAELSGASRVHTFAFPSFSEEGRNPTSSSSIRDYQQFIKTHKAPAPFPAPRSAPAAPGSRRVTAARGVQGGLASLCQLTISQRCLW